MNKQKGMIFAALFAALTASVASVVIPLNPVPITLQTLFVVLSGAMLGPEFGALAMIIYIILGLIGLPVFAGGKAGIGHLLGPTGGFLLSFPVAAFVIGKLTPTKKLPRLLFAMLIGMLIIYLIGAIQGTFVTHLSLTAIFAGWILPFIIGDTIKLLLAAWIARSIDINKYLRSPQ